MTEAGRRVNSIIVKNLPTDYNENQLEELFAKFGRIVSSKVLPSNANFDGGCGFVNFAEADSCNQAVEVMNNFSVDGYNLRVSHSMTRMNGNNGDRTSNGFRSNNGDTSFRSASSLDDPRGTSSPSFQQQQQQPPGRFSGFRPASERPSTSNNLSKPNSNNSSTHELDTSSTTANKTLWNSHTGVQPSRSPLRSEVPLNIQEHEPLLKNKSYSIYISNLEVPDTVFAATLDDYVNATVLITQMNKHEQLAKIQANTFKSKLLVGQYVAALFNGDWYRARILETDENRAHVQYVDWGNTNWCDSILEIRPLPNEFYNYPSLCVKCLLYGVPNDVKLTDQQTNTIIETLTLDTKLEMTVLRLENGIPYVQLNLGEKNLNTDISALFPSASTKTTPPVNQESNVMTKNKPVVNRTDIHNVQLTTVDAASECFHVLLMRDCLPTIMNVMKDWNASKQPLKSAPKVNSLVCAQYDGDDLWYRAWIENVTDDGYQVYFVDFGNEEVVSLSRLSECPEILRNIPWQSVQIKLAHIQLTDDERYVLLRDFETERLEMKIISQQEDVYLVELSHNGKSLTEHMFEHRQKKMPSTTIANDQTLQESVIIIEQSPAKAPQAQPTKIESLPSVDNNKIETRSPDIRLTSLPVQNETKTTSKPTFTNPPAAKPVTPISTVATPNGSTNSISEEHFLNLLSEQRRQNRLLEQLIAGINTTNALLAQLVQNSSV